MANLIVGNQQGSVSLVNNTIANRMGERLALRIQKYEGNQNKLAPLISSYDSRYLSSWRGHYDEWIKVFKYLMVQSGVTEENMTYEEDIELVLDMANKSFYAMTLREFELAMIYNLSGQHWDTIKHFQDFNGRHVLGVLGAYKKKRGKLILDAKAGLPEVEMISDKMSKIYGQMRSDLNIHSLIECTKVMLDSGKYRDGKWRNSVEFNSWASYFKGLAESGLESIPDDVKARLFQIALHRHNFKQVLPTPGEMKMSGYVGIKSYAHILYARLAWCYMCKHDLGPSAKDTKILTILANEKIEESVIVKKISMYKEQNHIPDTDYDRAVVFRYHDPNYRYIQPDASSVNDLQNIP